MIDEIRLPHGREDWWRYCELHQHEYILTFKEFTELINSQIERENDTPIKECSKP